MGDFIVQRGEASIEELIRVFSVSGPTVRRDLAVLAQAGIVVRTHGGVTAAGRGRSGEPLFMEKLRRQQSAKGRIAKAAARQVVDGMCLMLDSGTTCLALARLIAGRPMTIIALDIKTAEAAATGRTEVVVIGGLLRNGYFSVVGDEVVEAIARHSADLFFLSADAVDREGVSNVTDGEAEVKRTAMARARRTILVADHTKLNRREPAAVCGWEAIDLFLTDRHAGRAIEAYRTSACPIEVH